MTCCTLRISGVGGESGLFKKTDCQNIKLHNQLTKIGLLYEDVSLLLYDVTGQDDVRPPSVRYERSIVETEVNLL